ncbi:unnamed protein product [Ixodes persulcatus]
MSHFRRAFVTFARRTRSFPDHFPCHIAVFVPEIVLGPRSKRSLGPGSRSEAHSSPRTLVPVRRPDTKPQTNRRQTGRGFAKDASQGDGD